MPPHMPDYRTSGVGRRPLAGGVPPRPECELDVDYYAALRQRLLFASDHRIRVIMAPKAPDSNALRVRVGMLEDVESLVCGSRYFETQAGAAVLHRNRQSVRDAAPQKRDLD